MLLAPALVLAATAPHPAGAAPALDAARRMIRQATVEVRDGACAGVVAGDASLVLTAEHCLGRSGVVRVATHDGTRRKGRVLCRDAGSDLAVIRLDRPAPVVPLRIATEPPAPGAVLLFAGNRGPYRALQVAELTALDRCPSLPGVEDALFATVRARKGDSGAPVVDEDLRVVGIVHGGARCHIAAPTAALGRRAATAGSIDGAGTCGTASAGPDRPLSASRPSSR